MDNVAIDPQAEVLTTFEFTTLEGLHRAIEQMAYEFPDISRGEVYVEDRAGQSIGRLRIERSTLADGRLTYDAVLCPADDKDEIR